MRKIKIKELNTKSRSRTFNRARLRGFTLMELLVYVGVFSVASVFLSNILITVTNISTQESANKEVSSQLNTTFETIQRLIQEASNIESASGSNLKLRMPDPANDPTCITLESGVIKIAEGPGATPNACSTTKTDLTTNKVIANSLVFTKIENIKYSATEGKDLVGHSVVNIDAGLTYNTTNPRYQISRTLTSAVGRVSAATFDSDLLPDATGLRNIGTSVLKWQNLNVNGTAYFAGSVGIGITNPAVKLDVSGGIVRENGYNLAEAATNNLLVNGDFEQGNIYGWSGLNSAVTGGYSGNYAAQRTGSSTVLSDDYIPVDPTKDVFQLEGYFKKTVAGVTPGLLYFGYMAYNAAKTVITTAPCGSYCYFAASGYALPADSNWHKFSATTTGEGTVYPNFPVGTKYVRVLVLINYSASADAVTQMDHVTLKRINHGPLFVGNNFSTSNLLDQYQVSKIYTTNANHLILEPATSGNVGIGTTSPSAMLELGANAGSHGYIRFKGPTIAEGNIYHDATYGLHMDTSGNSLPIKIDGSAIYLMPTGSVGIGTTSPGAKLEVAGQVKITGGAPGAGKVLTSDAAGLATWESKSFSCTTRVTSISYYPCDTLCVTYGEICVHSWGTGSSVYPCAYTSITGVNCKCCK